MVFLRGGCTLGLDILKDDVLPIDERFAEHEVLGLLLPRR